MNNKSETPETDFVKQLVEEQNLKVSLGKIGNFLNFNKIFKEHLKEVSNFHCFLTTLSL
jgi:hypothetical protein